MPKFQWEGFSGATGKTGAGEMEAATAQQVTEALLAKGWHINNIQEARPDGKPMKTILDHSKKAAADDMPPPQVYVPRPWDAPKPGVKRPPAPKPDAIQVTQPPEAQVVPAPGLSGMPAAEAEIADLRKERAILLAQVEDLSKTVEVYKKMMTPRDEEAIKANNVKRATDNLNARLEIIDQVTKQAKGKIKAAAMEEVKEALVKKAILDSANSIGL